ncbi:spherulin-2A-like [Achroia grisella]|uniref:spherulin-2A-like n=1 Tax=Achroia grisella TaxID=688607 RepID=UPI0027D23121|nr:spherulin-2A-like [Achroia grisella]
MASKYLALLLLVPVVYANIKVNVVASDNEAEREVKFSGRNTAIISDKERNTFQLSDNNLKDAVRAFFGQRPDDAFLRSPTPWGDLYQTYGWPQVTRTLTPRRARVLQVSSNPSIVLRQHFENNSTSSGTFKAQIKQEVKNTVTSTWQKGGELSIGQDIEYGFDIKVLSVGGKTSFSYTSKWGESVSRSETVTVGSESRVEIHLEPGQKVIAELYATRGTMQIQVDYDATLSGSTAVNYSKKYNGHHFWALNINSVMRAGGLKSFAESHEVINLGYYSDSNIVIRDSKSNNILYNLPMSIF